MADGEDSNKGVELSEDASQMSANTSPSLKEVMICALAVFI